MASWLKSNHEKGGYLNLDFIQAVKKGENKELGEFIELKFLQGDMLVISQKRNKALYPQFLKYLEKRVGIFVDLTCDDELKLKKEGEDDCNQVLHG